MKHINHAARLPITMWLPEGEEIDPGVLTQAQNLANLPCAVAVALMPDTHLGYGMPIGGMLATERAVVPNAVGVDIGCGMMAAKLSMKADKLSKETLQAWRVATHSRVPVGFSGHVEPNEAAQRLDADYAKLGVLATDVSTTPKALSLVQHQIGTLGGGNHFIELQADVETDDVWLMLHSGSRGLGKAICDSYSKIAKEMCKAFGTPLADPDLAYLPQDLPVFFQYMSEMQFAMRFAEENRKEMWTQSLYALREVMGVKSREDQVGEIIETHHNFAAFEKHMGKNLIVHRKGAVKADVGTLVTIPGSMGSASYIGRGLGSRESYLTCSHGAGRLLGRKQANRTLTEEQCKADMEKAGTVFGMRSGQFDEMPACYKDIDAVMEAQRELVEPVTRLRPLAVVKG